MRQKGVIFYQYFGSISKNVGQRRCQIKSHPGPVWPRMALYGPVGPHMACMDQYGPVCPRMALNGRVWPCMVHIALYGPI